MSEQKPFAQVLTFSYDAANNRTQVNDSQSGIPTCVYDALDRLNSRKFSNGTSSLRIDPGWTNRDQLASLKRYTDLGGTSLVGMSSYTYDGAMRLSNLTHTYASGSVLASYAYGYDQASWLTSETVDGAATTYGYDATDQLTTVNGTATYSYDLNGNRTMTGYLSGPQFRGEGEAIGYLNFRLNIVYPTKCQRALKTSHRWALENQPF